MSTVRDELEANGVDLSDPLVARALAQEFAPILNQLGVSMEEILGGAAAAGAISGDGDGDDGDADGDAEESSGLNDPFAAIAADTDAPSVVDLLNLQTDSNAGVSSIEQGACVHASHATATASGTVPHILSRGHEWVSPERGRCFFLRVLFLRVFLRVRYYRAH